MATTMLATISSHSHGLSSMVLSPSGSLTSNTAGSPLPRIPRRTSSTQRAYCSGITISPKAVSSPVKITMQQATPLDDNSASTSGINADSSSCLSSARAKGPRGSRQVPAEPASPKFGIAGSQKERTVSLPRESEPPVLILKVLPSRTHSETQVAFPSVQPSSHKSAPLPPALVVRKKSGQLVKPSLKRSKSAFKGSLSVNPGGLSSKSEPATPTVPKAVKFDSRLEHVKLFLAEQRPRAVSRDGSPTDDTSGTESDFPSFIFGDTKSKSLKMMVTNMPPSLNLDTDIVMEEMKLSSDEISIVGRVRVRNISFQKWIATRFTFDDWQTTSEVTARYLESAGEGFDIFGFSIRLSDLMARIEEKTLIVALRYNVDGREIWDNNLGQNYVVKFAKEVPKSAGQPSVGALGSDRDISSGSDISDLHSRLEQVAQKRNETAAVPFSRPLTSSDPASALKAETSLSSRYDFGASFKSVSSTTFNTRQHTRMHSYPLVTSSSVGSVPRPEMSKRRVHAK
ncbi:hypothetical protein BT96DRAFT_214938 [Gymnopus androsaceus JB14]|uniref:CBM21 domain-containing protein n=1 Tax=Gymnopus androsaceus JB14 TaxID=1447944 RepID=A0A6A4H8Z0_9AGAR|nr:hypothetical protein BT96DRAFT_214938 [Gymnopus androsaceus JB14]